MAQGDKVAERLTALGKQAADARKAIDGDRNADAEKDKEKKQGKPSRVVANRAAGRVDDLLLLRAWYKFYAGYDPIFTWWAAEPYKQADAELEKYAEAIRQKLVKRAKDGDEVLGDPIGRECVGRPAHEFIPYTPDELIAIAEKEFAWCEAEYKKRRTNWDSATTGARHSRTSRASTPRPADSPRSSASSPTKPSTTSTSTTW